MSRSDYRVAVVQTRPRFGEVESNVAAALELAGRTLRRARGADLVVLPELFHSGYLFESRAEVRELAEDARRGPTVRALAEFCREFDTRVVAGLCERAGDQFYNSAVWVGARGLGGVYRKVHLFDREKLWFTPGTDAWPVFRAGPARVGVLICFDWRFPEAARALALAGADLLAHPSNLVQPHCQEAMRTRALENRVFCATANRTGEDRRARHRLRFTGASQVADPAGRVLWRAPTRGEAARVVTLDLARARDKKVTGRNHILRDRRPALYGAVTGTRPSSRARRRGR